VPSYDVYVSPTKRPVGERSGASLQDFWSHEGVRVKEVLSDLYGLPESRIELAAPIDDDARFDFVLVPPREESPDTMKRLMQEGIAKHFDVEAVREVRSMDVYVLTAPDGITGMNESGGGCMVMTMDETVGDVSIVDDAAMREHLEARRAAFEQGMKALAGRPRSTPMPRGRMSMSGARRPSICAACSRACSIASSSMRPGPTPTPGSSSTSAPTTASTDCWTGFAISWGFWRRGRDATSSFSSSGPDIF
jgi:hypothetical protein